MWFDTLIDNPGTWAISLGGLLTAGGARFIARLLGSMYGTYRAASMARREAAVTLREERADKAEEKAAATTQRLYDQLEKRVTEYGNEVARVKEENADLWRQNRRCETELQKFRDMVDELRGEIRQQSARIEYIREACPNCPNRLADASE